MKLLVIGLGQCGGRIADEFARLNVRAYSQRGIEIITGTFAINTDVADLSGLSRVKPDYQHRILFGGGITGGHGVDSDKNPLSKVKAKIFNSYFCFNMLSVYVLSFPPL